MAQLVQEPGGDRPGTSLVLRGKQGTGKGCFATQFGRIFGTHFLHITNQKQLTGRFNSHLKDALLVFCDEGIWAGDKSAEGVLKGMITEDLIMVEPKGKDPFAVKNHIRLIVASNNNWVIPAGLEERRFFVLDVDDKYMQNKDYFKALFEQMDNGGREAMLKDLLEYELMGFDLRTFPRTKALTDQILNSMNSVGKFWFDRLKDGSLGTIEDGWSGKVESEALYNHYLDFAGKIGDRYKVSESQFGKEIRDLCPEVVRKRMKRDMSQEKVYHLLFPSLEECRKLLESKVKNEIDWES
jgi:phage/plasmid-associated DNA primase